MTPPAHDVTRSRTSSNAGRCLNQSPPTYLTVGKSIGRHILHALIEFFDDSLLGRGTCFVLFLSKDKLGKREYKHQIDL